MTQDNLPDKVYSADERRVSDYIQEATGGLIGSGDDPIGFLIASHKYILSLDIPYDIGTVEYAGKQRLTFWKTIWMYIKYRQVYIHSFLCYEKYGKVIRTLITKKDYDEAGYAKVMEND